MKAYCAPGTYYFKDTYSKKYFLILDGEKVGEVASRKEAAAWYKQFNPEAR